MTKEEYTLELDKLKAKHKEEIRMLKVGFVRKNLKYKGGDTVRCNIGTFVIDKITWGIPFGEEIPTPIYNGFEITNKGKVRKNKNRISCYQNDAELLKSGEIK